MIPLHRRVLPLLVGIGLLTLAACDSGDPIDNGGGGSSPVSGTYAIEAFSVVPEASVIPPLNMLDTLVIADTRLQLFDGGDFVLTYRYLGGAPAAVIGRYSHSSRDVRLRAEPTSSDLHSWRMLLMSEQLVLQRVQEQPRVLSTSFRRSVDMASLSDGYAGIPPLTATVQFRVRAVGSGDSVPTMRRR